MKCTILIGPPCSGKSSFVNKIVDTGAYLSCDKIRESLWGKYIFDPKKEKEVWNLFYSHLEEFSGLGYNLIIDNTNCKMKYINKILSILPDEYEVEYVLFDVPLWKLYLRNYLRYFKIKKWIPLKVIRSMKKNFDNIKYDLWSRQYILDL